jgi:hypothetical protein
VVQAISVGKSKESNNTCSNNTGPEKDELTPTLETSPYGKFF